MKLLKTMIKPLVTFLAFLILGSSSFLFAAKGNNNLNTSGDSNQQVYDTTFAVEFSYSCLSGGCHETNENLVNEYAQSKMTHTMVKCNACHGTHTTEDVGYEKPNLTGYFPGIGISGYHVHTDRCKACHNNEHTQGAKSSDDCYSCHTPHTFDTRKRQGRID